MKGKMGLQNIENKMIDARLFWTFSISEDWSQDYIKL